MSDHELPACVRVALWGTVALGGGLPLADLPRRALPDLDHVEGLVEALDLWAGLGERVVLAALPRPGDLTGMPSASPEVVAAVTSAQECVFVPGLGGVAVPRIEAFGPVDDQGWSARWERFDAAPVPTHRIEALDLGQVELGLRQELTEATDLLLAVDRPALAGRRSPNPAHSRVWGLPPGLPPRSQRVVDLAGTVLRLAEAGLAPEAHAVDAAATARRDLVLRRLRDHATRALTEATNYGCLALAGWR